MDLKEKLQQELKKNEDTVLDDKILLEFSNDLIDFLRNQCDIPLKLYRYMPFNYNNVRSLETGKIYLTELGKMNDVFEGLVLSNAEKELDLRNLYDLAYLKAFSEENKNLLMWSHYGDNHKGICIEYDIKRLIHRKAEEYGDEHPVLYHLFPVIYTDKRIKNDLAMSNIKYAAKSIDEYKYDLKKGNANVDSDWHHDIKSLFLYKSKVWEYEKEWRIVVTFHQLKGESDESVDPKTELYRLNEQNISFDCVSAVYCGASLAEDKVMHLEEIVSNINSKRKSKGEDQVTLYKCALDSEYNKYEILLDKLK